jgi:multidrug efflux system membrane fusion protein
MKRVLTNRWFLAFVILLVAGLGAAYYFLAATHPATTAATAATAPAPPPANVTVKTLALEKVRLWSEYSGRLQAVDYAEIRPEVSGRITEVRFQDGQFVKAGDILVVIDPRPYQDAVERANAAVVSSQAKLELAKIQRDRRISLIASHSISQDELDAADSTYSVAEADVLNAQAALSQAKLDLEHAYVMAPISGRVSRAEITVGNLVQSGSSAPLLTSIVSQDGIYADFEVDEQTYMQSIRSVANGNVQEQLIPVQLMAQGDTGHVYDGFMQNFDNRIDSTSGTIRARAKFANTDGALVPGMFVSVKLAGGAERQALLVPERAISFDQSKKYVFVVGADNKVVYREVSLGQQVVNQRLVLSGLQPGERVVVDGVQRVRPSDVVVPTELPVASDLINGEKVAKGAQ